MTRPDHPSLPPHRRSEFSPPTFSGRSKLGRMRRSGLLAFVGLAVALVVSACSFGSSPGGTAASPAADSAGSGRPAATLASAATQRAAALPRKSTAGTSVTLTAVGDMMLGNTPDLAPDPGTYFQAVKPELKNGAQIDVSRPGISRRFQDYQRPF